VTSCENRQLGHFYYDCLELAPCSLECYNPIVKKHSRYTNATFFKRPPPIFPRVAHCITYDNCTAQKDLRYKFTLQYYAGHVGSGAAGDLVQDDNRNNCKHFFSFLNLISSYLTRLCALRFQALRIRIEIVLPLPPKME